MAAYTLLGKNKFSFRQLKYHNKFTTWSILACCLVITWLILTFYMDPENFKYLEEIKFTSDFNEFMPNQKAFIINTPGCKIPDFNPFDEQIKPFIKPPLNVICNYGKPALYESDLTSVYLLKSSLSAYKINDLKKLVCCHYPFWRNDVNNHQVDHSINRTDKCNFVFNKTTINSEFTAVYCWYDKVIIYSDTFAFVPVNKIKTVSKPQNSSLLNVLIVGMDSLSRLNFYRQMNQTVNYLKSIGGFEFLGYNKVGDNTFPNLIPVLTGLNQTELTDTCWPSRKHYFDNCSFIWEDYKKQGYVTAYGEDASWLGLFTYYAVGFQKQPTDFGYNYFNYYSEKICGNVEYGTNLCQSSRFIYKDFQEYIKKFVVTMDKNMLPYFAFFWGVSLFHSDLNLPKIGDKDYYNLFKYFKDNGYLDNTVFIVMSDHGARWGKIRETYQGSMEDRLPFLFMVLPDKFQKQYSSSITNLVKNTHRLTTPFDLHETLVDLLNMNRSSKISARGISLFKEIGENRTCDDASIESHWCTCQQRNDINTNSTIVEDAAKFSVSYINDLLLAYYDCVGLTLVEIKSAKLMLHRNVKIQDYFLIIKTEPGDALFEVTVRYDLTTKVFSIVSTISRLTYYHHQSLCIEDYHLKLYCYCRNLL